MYCRFCGKQIDDGSNFCSQCGEKLTETNKRDSIEKNHESNKLSQNTPTETNGDSSIFGFVMFVSIAVISLVIFTFAAYFSSGFEIKPRDLRSSDYTYTTSQDLTSYRITVLPNRNIDNCDIQLTLYNSNGEKIFSDTISKTDLKEGCSYTYLFDFGFVNSLSGSKVKYNITGKCK